jgi:parallel beta-helix repeat protein
VLVIDVPVTIKAVGPGRVIVDGRCQTRFTIDVLADHVMLKRLTVQGATSGLGDFPSEVNFSGVSDGAARRMLFRDTCDAEYGINVFGTGDMVVRRSEARGFSDAGIYIGGITAGPVTALENETHSNNRGIIVEDSTPGTVAVLDNRTHDNPAPGEGLPSGIFVHNSDGELFRGNLVADNGLHGIHVDPTSDGNRLFSNAISGSGTLDDEGTANCWNGTTYATASPNPPPTC